MLPEKYVASDVQLSPEEHAGSAPLYEAIALAQKKLADGLQVDDVLAIPTIAAKASETVRFIVSGDEADPTDDEELADRMLAVGFALVRASHLLKKKAEAPPE